MKIEEIVIDKLFSDLNKVISITHSCKACLANKEYAQAMERLQRLGVTFSEFECAVIDNIDINQ